MIKKFKFIQNNGYSRKNPRMYIGNGFEPIVNKINKLIKVINIQEAQINELLKKLNLQENDHLK